MKKSRELSSHTYDSETAEALTEAIASTYFTLLDELRNRLEQEVIGGELSLF